MSTTRRALPVPSGTARLHGRLAQRLLDHLDPLVEEMTAAILAAVPALAADPALAHDTRASTRANVVRWASASAARPDEPVSIDVPPEALDLARDVVRRGMQRDILVTAYRQGQNVAWQTYMAHAREARLDAVELVAVLDIASQSLFAYVDGILGAMAGQMEAEREELLGGALARKRETIMLILDGAPITAARAGVLLGHELARSHVAFVIWGDDGGVEPGDLERHAGAIARRLGARRPVTVPAGASVLWAWASGVAPDSGSLRAAIADPPPGLRVAAGSPQPGVAGFRDSHLEARDAQRLLMRRPGEPPAVTYDDVRVVSLASQDEARAAAFIAATLGELRNADPQLRDTVRVYLQEDAGASRAARRLHAHRNTVLKRLARAQALLPRPLAGHGLEVRLALELQLWLRPAARESG